MTLTSRPAALSWLAAERAGRVTAGLDRTLVPRPARAAGVLDLASNDYLGLARHPAVVEAGVEALRGYGTGATGSRLVTGTTALHLELEHALVAAVGAASALVYSSGYLANLGAVAAVVGRGALVVSDERNHASLVDACRLSRARVVVVPHGDVGSVERALADRTEDRAAVVTDALFSVDGDLAPLPELHAVARRHGAVLLVDEAHAFGVVGPSGAGACAAAGLAGSADVVMTVTLSKALGGQGGAVLGPAALRDHLVDTSRTFIFDTALAPAAAGAALAALRQVDATRVRALAENIRALAGELGLPTPDGALLTVRVPDPHRAAAARDACLDRGVRVGCFRPPSVPEGQSCLRLTARADLDPSEVVRAGDVVRDVLA